MSGEPKSNRSFPFIYPFTQILFVPRKQQVQATRLPTACAYHRCPSGHGASPNLSPGSTSPSLAPVLDPLESFCGLPLLPFCLRRLPFLPPLSRTSSDQPACSFPPFSQILTTLRHPRLSLYHSISGHNSHLETISLLSKHQRRYVLHYAYSILILRNPKPPSFPLWAPGRRQI